MPEEKTTNRWLVVVGALLIQIALGAVYIWSVFKGPLMTKFKWDAAPTNLTFSIIILVFAIGTVIFGKMQDKIGPRSVATIGGILLGVGLVLAKWTTSLGWLYITFGVIGGLGIGAGYVCPLSTCVKWFPDKKGLITGLAVAGFGGGALVFTPVAKSLIASKGVLDTFAYLGIIFGICVVIGAQFLKNPPPGYKPAGWEPPVLATGKASGGDYDTGEMVKTAQFYLMWISYLFGSAAGLMIISNALPIATAQGLGEALAASAVMTVSVFNAAGRLIWGTVSDKLGRTKTLLIIFTLCGITMIGLKALTGTSILLGVSLVGFCFGGYLAIYPSMTADYFGTKSLGMNYGTVFMAYGIGALLGPMLYDLMKSPVAGQLSSTPLIISGVLCFVSLALILMLKPPAKA
ncbi:MAG: putative MFS-type transporter YhjX [Pelotomaculum sp. PtaB.Bin013]|uniref:OFA family MFS transporter n=1 Tax=Pelotomaculum isophthalicicum JI TaxID=947010 RepID=A0A9X4H111_9FIRM|nr:OFA family MFS transporter [Pelotomaculum isophthalicicum]MDF9407246.1 OFA family MFS transporter [Pelotomaculum isophthalicicum JI]OPX92090.1 MAG: putative MFS-type transporter YhjX [Pelotomaculum sp. PtaB.Bin013]